MAPEEAKDFLLRNKDRFHQLQTQLVEAQQALLEFTNQRLQAFEALRPTLSPAEYQDLVMQLTLPAPDLPDTVAA